MTDEEKAWEWLDSHVHDPPTPGKVKSLAALLRAAREEGERDAFAATAAFLRAGQRSYEAKQVEMTDWRAKALRNVRGGK